MPMANLERAAAGLARWIFRHVADGEPGEADPKGGAVFGLSGGVDSALVAALCRRALGDRCLAVVMPCHSDAADVDDARRVGAVLDVPTIVVDLDESFDALIGALPATGSGGRKPESPVLKVARANIKPRLRMAVLYYYANLLGYRVVGSDNRSERAVGYFTKYGDGGADLQPLAGLVKSEVTALARHLGVPEDILERVPSAGLWEGQTDEGEMGVTYEQLDRYLLTGEGDERAVARIEALRGASAHKRAMPPMGPTMEELLSAPAAG